MFHCIFCIENKPSASSPHPIKILEINYANHVGCELATCRTRTSDRMSQCYDGVRSGWGDIIKIHTCQILNVR